MSIVWPCPLPVDVYALMGRAVRVPRPKCPSCRVPVVFWSGYWRYIRWRQREAKIFIRRVRCGGCGVTHALLPAFTLAWRLDAVDTSGAVIGRVAGGGCGVRPAAAAAGVPYPTARGWVRRFGVRAGELAVSFSALCAELGGEAGRPLPDRSGHAVAAIGAAFTAATAPPGLAGLGLPGLAGLGLPGLAGLGLPGLAGLGLPGLAGLGPWRFASAVTGGSLLAANASSPWLAIGRWRFMPPRSP